MRQVLILLVFESKGGKIMGKVRGFEAFGLFMVLAGALSHLSSELVIIQFLTTVVFLEGGFSWAVV